MQGVHLRKYGVETIINFELYEVDGVDLRVDAEDAGSDCNIRKDQGADATCENDFVDEGLSYSLTITATEMEAKCITLHIVDSATKVWLDKVICIETYGHASAQHAFDLDTASVAQSADNETRLTTIETDANEIQGKLPTNKFMGSSDGADDDGTLNTIATDAARLTAARAGVLTDLIDGGRLDLLIDAILLDTGTDGVVLKAAGLNTDAVDKFHDEVIEGTITHRQAMKLILAVLTGKSSGGGTTTLTFRDIGNTKDRLICTVDPNGNRTAVTTRDGS